MQENGILRALNFKFSWGSMPLNPPWFSWCKSLMSNPGSTPVVIVVVVIIIIIIIILLLLLLLSLLSLKCRSFSLMVTMLSSFLELGAVIRL